MATIGSIINALYTSKCTQNIEKMKVKLPSDNKFCSFDSITEQEARNLVKEFGHEIPCSRKTMRGCDPNIYEIELFTSDPHAKALLRVEHDGTLTKFISNINNQYSIEMYSKQRGLLKNTSNNGITFELKENPTSDKRPDNLI